MVGTIHLYEEAAPRLRSILEALAPEVITVEISRFSIEFRRDSKRIWSEKFHLVLSRLNIKWPLPPVLELLRRQLSTPYEWTTAEKYGVQHGIRVIPVDTSTLSRKELPSWERYLLTVKNFRLLLEDSSLVDLEREHFGPIKREARALLSGVKKQNIPDSIHPLSWLSDPFWQKREETLARRIARICNICERVVHIGGWMHCVAGSPWSTLVDILKRNGIEVEVRYAF